MSRSCRQNAVAEPAVEVHLLGQVDFEACLALKQRLVYETAGSTSGQVTLLVCEHFPTITVGRDGSWSHIGHNTQELARRQLGVRWVNRGGGCIVHAPGQLAIYPIVPLACKGMSVGDYLDRLQRALAAALAEVGFHGQGRPGRYGLWGRLGQVAAVGVAVKSWVTYYGAYVNVCPAMPLVRGATMDPVDGTLPSSLAAERQRPVRMSGVRERLVRHLAEALGGGRYHLYTGHPLFPPMITRPGLSPARVG